MKSQLVLFFVVVLVAIGWALAIYLATRRPRKVVTHAPHPESAIDKEIVGFVRRRVRENRTRAQFDAESV